MAKDLHTLDYIKLKAMKNLIVFSLVLVLFACKKEDKNIVVQDRAVKIYLSTTVSGIPTRYTVYHNGILHSSSGFSVTDIQAGGFAAAQGDSVRIRMYNQTYSKTIKLTVGSDIIATKTSTLDPFEITVIVP